MAVVGKMDFQASAAAGGRLEEPDFLSAGAFSLERLGIVGCLDEARYNVSALLISPSFSYLLLAIKLFLLRSYTVIRGVTWNGGGCCRLGCTLTSAALGDRIGVAPLYEPGSSPQGILGYTLLPEVVPEIDANPESFFNLTGRGWGVGHVRSSTRQFAKYGE